MSRNKTARELRKMEARRLRKRNEKQIVGKQEGAPVNITADFGSNRAEISRANAQHSTGPRTEAGKLASSRNAVRHGLTGTFCVLPTEDMDAYHLLLTELMVEHDPMTATEELLVGDMVRHYWLAQRALRLQDDLMMTYDITDANMQKQLALFIRYQTTNQRAFHKALTELSKLQKERKKEQAGFVSQSEDLDEIKAPVAAPKARVAAREQGLDPFTGFVSQNDPITTHQSREASTTQS